MVSNNQAEGTNIKQLPYDACLCADTTPLDELMKDSLTTRVRDAALSQPLTTIIQIALVDLLDSWGIRPTRVTGHSSGEIAAAYCSRALTQKDAIRVAFHRGIMAEKLGATRIGAMIAVGLPEDDTRCLIESLSQGVLKVACVNSPSSVTVSGDREAVLELSQLLHAKGAFKRELAVDVAYHSHHMGDVADEYLASLSGLSSSDDSTNIEFYSSVTGKHVASSQLGAEYWVSNMVDPVQFSTSVKNLLHVGDPHAAIDILLEIGPHSTLQGPIRQILQSDEKTSVQYKASLIRNTNAIHTLHECVAFLVREGCSANLGAVNGAVESKIKSVLNDLPPYPWDHSKSYWAERTRMCEIDKQVYCRSDLIGVRVKDSISIEPRWRNIIRAAEIPWVNDHIVQSSTLYPAAGFLAMAIEAGYQHAGPKRNNLRGYRLREISIGHALIIPQDASNIETLISLQPYNESMRSPSGLWSQFNIYSSTDNSPWTEHCRGLISVEENLHQTEVDGGRSALWKAQSYRRMVLSFKEECVTSVDGKEMYQSLDKLGLNFGPTFMNLRSVRVTKDRSIAEITIPNTIQVMPAHFEYPFIIHPATLDSCIHALFPINDRQNKLDRGTPVPTFIEELFVSQDVAREPGHVFDVCAQWETKSAGFEASNGIDEEVGSLTVFDHHSTNFLPKILIKELTFKSLPNTTHEQLQRDERRPCYKIDWQPDPSLLSPEQAVKITAAVRTPLPERDQTLVSQQAAFYYAELALSSVKTEEVMSMHPHHRKLYATLTSHCDAIHKGHWGHFCTYDWVRLNPEQRAAVCAGVDQTPYGILLRPVGENLAQILRQELDPLSIMVENNRLERYYRTWEPIRQSYQQAAVFIKLLGHKNPHLNILEVGAGTGGASLTILEALDDMSTSPPNFRNYDFTDISPAFFEKAAEKLVRWTGMVKFLRFDAERDPLQQGFKSCSYDLIVAANVIHATSCIERTLKSMIKLLKPGGTLVLVEVTVNTIGASLMFGTLPGWWNGMCHHVERCNLGT